MSEGRVVLTEPQQRALQIVFEVFRERAEWPAYQFVDRQLHRAGLPSADVIASLPLELAQFDRYHPLSGHIALTVAGIAAIDPTAAELDVFLQAVRWLAQREEEYQPPSPTEPGQATGTSAEFVRDEGLELDRIEQAKIVELLRVEWLTAGSGSNAEQEPFWQVSVDEKIRPYAGVETIEKYLAIKQQILDEARQRLPPARPIEAADPAAAELTRRAAEGAADPRKVFVVHGRNGAAQVAIFELLRAFGLHPLEWSELRAATGKPSPYIGEILDAGFAMSQACVVVMTPDEEVRLRDEFVEDEVERIVAHQPRPNVLLEMGMALYKYRDRTVIVELGRMRLVSDLAGIHTLRMDDSIDRRKELAERLRDAQCEVRLEGTAWQTAGRFDDAIGTPPTSRLPTVDTDAERARAQLMSQLRQEYVLSHDGLSPGMLAGTEPLPEEWYRRRLHELGLAED